MYPAPSSDIERTDRTVSLIARADFVPRTLSLPLGYLAYLWVSVLLSTYYIREATCAARKVIYGLARATSPPVKLLLVACAVPGLRKKRGKCAQAWDMIRANFWRSR